MNYIIREYKTDDIPQMIDIWNDIVFDGLAFPQEDFLTLESGAIFFSEQTYTGVAVNNSNEILGLYILHPNNIGRCGHICNASYAIKKSLRNMHIGEAIVKDCLKMGKEKGFKILQFNAVVATNHIARHLYEKLGFIQLGVIPNGFRKKSGEYEDICPYYHEL